MSAVQEILTSRFVLLVESVYTNAMLPDAVMLGRAYDQGGASPVGLQGHMIWCSKRYAGNSSGGVYTIRATPALRPLCRSNVPTQGEERNWYVCARCIGWRKA